MLLVTYEEGGVVAHRRLSGQCLLRLSSRAACGSLPGLNGRQLGSHVGFPLRTDFCCSCQRRSYCLHLLLELHVTVSERLNDLECA